MPPRNGQPNYFVNFNLFYHFKPGLARFGPTVISNHTNKTDMCISNLEGGPCSDSQNYQSCHLRGLYEVSQPVIQEYQRSTNLHHNINTDNEAGPTDKTPTQDLDSNLMLITSWVS